MDKLQGIKEIWKKHWSNIERILSLNYVMHPEDLKDVDWLIKTIEQQQEKIQRYENVIASIANIDCAFLTPEGDCEYTDKQALEKIEETVKPIWEEIAKRKNEES